MDIFVSSGDINGTSLELILKNHDFLSKKYNLVYVVDSEILLAAKNTLRLDINLNALNLISPSDYLKDDGRYIEQFRLFKSTQESFISPNMPSAFSGFYSFYSFDIALKLALKSSKKLLTMPINKYSWNLAGINFAGHTQYLRYFFKKDAIMMLGNKNMFIALFSDHIPLKDVARLVTFERFSTFLLNFYNSFLQKYFQNSKKIQKVAVLGLNPHAGDNGVIGSEDELIKKAINYINKNINQEIFIGPIPGDSAFIKQNRQKYKIFVAPYHDLGLATLKALYFDNSINVSLNLDIKRTSPDHGSGYDIAYKNSALLSSNSYLRAIEFLEAM